MPALKLAEADRGHGWTVVYRALCTVGMMTLLTMPFPASAAEDGAPVTDDAALYRALGAAPPRSQQVADGFELPSLKGDPVRLADLSGGLVLVNFWATWCQPCIREMPSLEALWKRLQPRGLTVVGINVDRHRRKAVKAFVADHGLSFPIALDGWGKARRRYRVAALPVTFLIGADGVVLAQVIGERDWDAPDVVAALDALLETQ